MDLSALFLNQKWKSIPSHDHRTSKPPSRVARLRTGDQLLDAALHPHGGGEREHDLHHLRAGARRPFSPPPPPFFFLFFVFCFRAGLDIPKCFWIGGSGILKEEEAKDRKWRCVYLPTVLTHWDSQARSYGTSFSMVGYRGRWSLPPKHPPRKGTLFHLGARLADGRKRRSSLCLRRRIARDTCKISRRAWVGCGHRPGALIHGRGHALELVSPGFTGQWK